MAAQKLVEFYMILRSDSYQFLQLLLLHLRERNEEPMAGTSCEINGVVIGGLNHTFFFSAVAVAIVANFEIQIHRRTNKRATTGN